MKKLDLLTLQQNFIQSLSNSGKSFNTCKNYKTDLNIFNQFLIEKKKSLNIKELTFEELKEYQRFLEKKYNSPNSIRRRVQALRLFFDYLIQIGEYSENPIKKMIVSPKVVSLPKPVSFPQIQKLIKHLEHLVENSSELEELLNMRNLTLVHLIYGGGFKVSEIERIKMQHIKKAKGKYRVLVAPEKREPYTVSLPENFNDIFTKYQELLEKRQRLDQIDFDDLLFNANPFKILSGGLSARGIEIIFKELSSKLETQMTAKSLRQACIFKWLTQQMPESRIKELMGVQPIYSLNPYKELIKLKPSEYCYMELQP